MAVYRIFPEKDTFIFSEASSSNAGLDEIVELGGYYDVTGIGEASRVLVQFSSTEIADIVTNKIKSNNYSASLGLYLADAYQIPVDTNIYTYPIYSSAGGWDNGTGKYGDIPTNTSGVSWGYQKSGLGSTWLSSMYPTGVTACGLLKVNVDNLTGFVIWPVAITVVNVLDGMLATAPPPTR